MKDILYKAASYLDELWEKYLDEFDLERQNTCMESNKAHRIQDCMLLKLRDEGYIPWFDISEQEYLSYEEKYINCLYEYRNITTAAISMTMEAYGWKMPAEYQIFSYTDEKGDFFNCGINNDKPDWLLEFMLHSHCERHGYDYQDEYIENMEDNINRDSIVCVYENPKFSIIHRSIDAYKNTNAYEKYQELRDVLWHLFMQFNEDREFVENGDLIYLVVHSYKFVDESGYYTYDRHPFASTNASTIMHIMKADEIMDEILILLNQYRGSVYEYKEAV